MRLNQPSAMTRSSDPALGTTQSGFTLVELMIVVAILALLVTVGIPSFNSFLADNRMSSYTNDLIADLNLARSEAIKRNTPVSICSSTDQASCANSSSWNTGWVIFTDTGTEGTVDGTDTILYARESAGSATMTLTVDRNYTRFLPSGFAN